MNYRDIYKNKRIRSVVEYFLTKYGNDKIKIKDYWEADCNAIGLTDSQEKHLVYFSTYSEQEDFYVSLENLIVTSNLPYEPVGEFDHIDLNGLEEIIIAHLHLSPL